MIILDYDRIFIIQAVSRILGFFALLRVMWGLLG